MRKPANLTDRYRPHTLSEVLGQAPIVRTLQSYTDSPYPAAFLFAGPTGAGKTSAAKALANDLGVSPASDLLEFKSGELDGTNLEWLARQLAFAPMSRWRLVLCDEADLMTPKAEAYFLSLLDDLPGRTTLISTTNRPEWFGKRQRLLDRFERFNFESRYPAIHTEARELVAKIWYAETGRTDPPSLESLQVAVDGELSFRRVVSALAPLVREAQSQKEETFRLEPPKRKPHTGRLFRVNGRPFVMGSL